MQTTAIIDSLVALHGAESERPIYRQALCELVKLARAELVLAMTLDMLRVHVAMSDEFND